jgi:hypothetical protein
MSRGFALRFVIKVARDLTQRSGDLRVARRCGSFTQMNRARAEIVRIMHVAVAHRWLRCGLPVHHDGTTPFWSGELPALTDFRVISEIIRPASVKLK